MLSRLPKTLVFFILILGIQILPVSAGNCFSLPRDPDDNTPAKPASIWATCKNRPDQWACADPSIDFPTVECLAADMRTCGIVGTGPTIFYSFGATTVQVRTRFRDTLDPRGIMWNDVLDEKYGDEVLKKRFADFRLDIPTRLTVYTARFAEAMATVASGEVFFAVKNYDGEGGGKGAYQTPTTSGINVWRTYEFPTLQRNKDVTSVVSIDINNDNSRSVDWKPDGDMELLPASGASSLNVPSVPGCSVKFRRDASCVAPLICETDGEDEECEEDE